MRIWENGSGTPMRCGINCSACTAQRNQPPSSRSRLLRGSNLQGAQRRRKPEEFRGIDYDGGDPLVSCSVFQCTHIDKRT